MGKDIHAVAPDLHLPVGRKSSLKRLLKEQGFLLLVTVPFILYIFLFSYLPLAGWIVALFDYHPGKPLAASSFVGIKYFTELFASEGFWLAMRNTLVLSGLGMSAGTACSVGFAILLQELSFPRFRKWVQTISYLPHFVSWVVVAGIFVTLLKMEGGAVNGLLLHLGVIDKPFPFLLKGELYWGLITIISVWKETGWSAIIYLAAMTGINPELYESAYMDGAGRWRRIWHVTLPGIRTTIIILTILGSGWILGAGFEQSLLFGNGANFDQSEVLGSYIYRYGLKMGRFSFSTAASIFQSLTGLAVVALSNRMAGKLSEARLF